VPLICPHPIRDTARALAIKATEFHCNKIRVEQRERERERQDHEEDDNEGEERNADRSVTMHPKGPTATMSLQGSLSKCRNYSE